MVKSRTAAFDKDEGSFAIPHPRTVCSGVRIPVQKLRGGGGGRDQAGSPAQGNEQWGRSQAPTHALPEGQQRGAHHTEGSKACC